MDIWEIYHNSFDRELNSDEIDFLDTMIRKYPYFAAARFLKAKAVPTTYNMGLASAYAPSRALFKSFMEGEKSVRELENRTVMDTEETQIDIPTTQQKHQLFCMTAVLSHEPTEAQDMPFSILIPDAKQTYQGFLDTLIKEKVQKYLDLPNQISVQISQKQGLEEPAIKPSSQSLEPTDNKAEELIQRFLDNNPKIKRPKIGKEPANQAMGEDKSVNLDEEIVSETLAKIHLKQNNIAEALRIYRKLSLLFPEKSAYFDAQISEITHI